MKNKNQKKYSSCYCSITNSFFTIIEYKNLPKFLQDKYKNHIYCSNCKNAKLTFVNDSFFRSYPSTPHKENCLFSFLPTNSTSRTIIIEKLGDEVIEKIFNKFLRSIDASKKLINVSTESNEIIEENLKSSINKKSKKTFEIQQKQLKKKINEKDLGKAKLYYGEVKFRNIELDNKNCLTILIDREKICNVYITKKVLHYFSDFNKSILKDNGPYFIYFIAEMKKSNDGYFCYLIKHNCFRVN